MTKIQNLQKLSLKLDVSGQAEAINNVKLYRGSFGFVTLQCYVPVTQNRVRDSSPLCTVHRVVKDNVGRIKQFNNEHFDMVYVGKVTMDGCGYLLFERPLPEPFTRTAGELDVVINYCEIKNGKVVSRLATNVYHITVSDGGVAETELETDLKSLEAAQINANTAAIESLTDDVERLLQPPDCTEAEKVGTPTVEITAEGKFKFSNLKGESLVPRGAWINGAEYKKYDAVSYNGAAYAAVSDVVSTMPPREDKINWAELIQPTLNVRGDYDKALAYYPGDSVTYEGTQYRCKAQAPPGTLPTDTAHWSVFATAGSHIQNADIHVLPEEKLKWNAAESEAVKQSKRYTDEELAQLVNSAPEMLDTLQELAAAVGDNPNHAAEMLEIVGRKAEKIELAAHAESRDNPHGITKSQIGLGNVDNTADAVKHVDKANVVKTMYNNECVIADGFASSGGQLLVNYRSAASRETPISEYAFCDGCNTTARAAISAKDFKVFSGGVAHSVFSPINKPTVADIEGGTILPLRTATVIVGLAESGYVATQVDVLIPIGTVDCTPYIQQAIDLLPASGGEIKLLNGTYVCDGERVAINKNATISGCGIGVTILQATYDGYATYFTTSTTGKYTFRDFSLVTPSKKVYIATFRGEMYFTRVSSNYYLAYNDDNTTAKAYITGCNSGILGSAVNWHNIYVDGVAEYTALNALTSVTNAMTTPYVLCGGADYADEIMIVTNNGSRIIHKWSVAETIVRTNNYYSNPGTVTVAIFNAEDKEVYITGYNVNFEIGNKSWDRAYCEVRRVIYRRFNRQ